MRPLTPFLFALCLALVSRAGAAPPAPANTASQEFIIEGQKGAFEVTVSPTYVTVFYLPEPVTKALASDQKNFSITVMQDTVAVRPLKGETGLTANLNIETKSLKISVILRVGPDTEALSQVIFTRAEDKAIFEKRVSEEVERRLAPLVAEVERKERDLDAEIEARAQERIAAGMAEAFEVRSLDGIARTDDNVIIRVTRAVRIGDEVYLHFNIQNRDSSPYRLRAVEIVQGKTVTAGHVAVEPRAQAEAPLLGAVAGGKRGGGVVVVPKKKLADEAPFAVRFTDANGGALSVGDLRL